MHLYYDLISLFSVFIDAAEATGGGGYYSVSEGRSKLFSCPVDGNPEPNITWYKDNYVIGLESFTAISFFGRKISNAKELKANETGCYTCSANNSLGPPVTITHCLTVGKIISLLYHYL